MTCLLLSMLAPSVWKWIHRLGGPGLILLGIADNTPFRLCPTWKCRHIRHPAVGTPTRMVGLLRLHGYRRRSFWGLSNLPIGRKRRPKDLGKENQETACRENLQILREPRVPNGDHRFPFTPTFPLHIGPDGRWDHAVSAQGVL